MHCQFTFLQFDEEDYEATTSALTHIRGHDLTRILPTRTADSMLAIERTPSPTYSHSHGSPDQSVPHYEALAEHNLDDVLEKLNEKKSAQTPQLPTIKPISSTKPAVLNSPPKFKPLQHNQQVMYRP